MTQPLNRTGEIPKRRELDEEHGEFWVKNPFWMPGERQNLSAFERNRLYLNARQGPYVDASFASSADIDADSRSVVAADFDRNGAPDLLVCSVGGGPLRLFLNRFPQQNRAHVEFVGKTSNRQGIGARIILECGGQKIIRDIFPPNPFMGQGPPLRQVGVGRATRIDRLTIRWPTGSVDEFRDLPVNRRVRLVEGEAKPQVLESR